MDPVFERRELTRSVHIHAPNLQRNIHVSLLAQLRMKYEGVCIPEGFIQRRSITIVEHSLGRINLIKGGLEYTVKFQADVCMPHPDQVFRATVTLRSKIGLHAELLPMKVLLPRDLHLGNGEFEDIKEKQEIEFKVVGSRFQQGDDSIVVLGTLTSVINPAAEQAIAAVTDTAEPLIAASAPGDPSEKRVVQVSQDIAKASEPVRRKKLVKPPAAQANEPPPQGKAPGTA
jgi:DNA-directed RNA polymerase subunit E'/Rpb7